MVNKMTFLPVARATAIIMLAGFATGCAITPDASDPEAVAEMRQINDPAEPTNRQILKINRSIDTAVLKPVAETYRDTVPVPIRLRVSNFLNNLHAPVIFINDVLQGEIDRALTTATRFFINSTFGLAGMHDLAHEMNLKAHDEDFGQTLAVWGIGEGPYMILPVIGPSNPRDTAGLVADILFDPFGLWLRNTGNFNASLGHRGGETIDYRTDNIDIIEDLEKSSLDFYASVRSLYRQKRNTEISNGALTSDLPSADITELMNGPEPDNDYNNNQVSFVK